MKHTPGGGASSRGACAGGGATGRDGPRRWWRAARHRGVGAAREEGEEAGDYEEGEQGGGAKAADDGCGCFTNESIDEFADLPCSETVQIAMAGGLNDLVSGEPSLWLFVQRPCPIFLDQRHDREPVATMKCGSAR